MRTLALLIVALVSVLHAGCGDCEGAAADADTFVEDPANQACVTDADCVVVTQNCAPMKTGFCGQVAMSATAAASKRWADIETAMEACDDECSVCLAQLVVSCENGLCRRPSK